MSVSSFSGSGSGRHFESPADFELFTHTELSPLSYGSYRRREAEGLQALDGSDAPEVVVHNVGTNAPEVLMGQEGLEVHQEEDYRSNTMGIPTPEGDQLPQYPQQYPSQYLRGEQSSAPLMGAKENWNGGFEEPKRKRICGMSRKWFYILLAVIAVVIIAAAVGGGVGGSKHSSSPASGTAPVTVDISNSSRLAAVAYDDTNNIQQSRVYYQDTNNNIKESAWNATSGTWYLSNSNVTVAKANTPIAISAYTTSDQTTLSLFYFENDNNVIAQLTSIDHGVSWQVPANLPPATDRAADDDSKLTAATLSHAYCTDCSNNTIVVYQSNSNLAVANISSVDGSWDFTAEGLDAEAIAGTDLTMFYYQDNNLRLWFQGSEQDLHFYGWPITPGTNSWTDRGNLAHGLSKNSPLASFCSFESDSTTSTSEIYQIAYFQATSEPSFNMTGWVNQPDLNSSDWSAAYNPSGTTSLKANETMLAATVARRVYVLTGGIITEYEVDETSTYLWTTWTQLGTVVTS